LPCVPDGTRASSAYRIENLKRTQRAESPAPLRRRWGEVNRFRSVQGHKASDSAECPATYSNQYAESAWRTYLHPCFFARVLTIAPVPHCKRAVSATRREDEERSRHYRGDDLLDSRASDLFGNTWPGSSSSTAVHQGHCTRVRQEWSMCKHLARVLCRHAVPGTMQGPIFFAMSGVTTRL